MEARDQRLEADQKILFENATKPAPTPVKYPEREGRYLDSEQAQYYFKCLSAGRSKEVCDEKIR